MEERKTKIQHKQKLSALLERNKRLQKNAPRARKSVLIKLQRNHRAVRYELKYTLNKIENLEEHIVRKGCPGIKLD